MTSTRGRRPRRGERTDTREVVYEIDRHAVAVDLVVFSVRDRELSVLLVRRGIEPFLGAWALPGGFVRAEESVDECARRELREETGVADIFLEQLYTFGDLHRDPRFRVITVAYFAIIAADRQTLRATTDAAEARWVRVDELPPLAFDHDRIVAYAVERLRGKLEYSTIGFQLVPERFTLGELQSVYELVLGKPLDKRNFRKKILALGLVHETDETRTGGGHRPARLYRFADPRPMTLKEKRILVPA